MLSCVSLFFFSSRRRHTRLVSDWSSDVCSSDLDANYSIDNLIDCIENDRDIQSFYAADTCRSVIQPLRSLARMPLFESVQGTPLTELAEAGVMSILCLGRLTEDLRTVLTTVLSRQLNEDGRYASQITMRGG